MRAERHTCEWCGERIDPSDRVVQGAPGADGQGPGPVGLDGEEFIYHEHDWDPSFGQERYRGPLSDLRPNDN